MQAAQAIVASVDDALREAHVLGEPDPMLFIGLRLVQRGTTKCAASTLPPTHISADIRSQREREVCETPPMKAGTNAASELARAQAELVELRERLRHAELREVAQAKQVIQLADGASSSGARSEHYQSPATYQAATAIQASYQGFVARQWVQEMLREASDPTRAVTTIQACYKGYVARRWVREVSEHEPAAAANAIQAACHGSSARSWVNETLHNTRGREEAVAAAIQAACHGRSAREYALIARRSALREQVAAITIQAACHGHRARSFCRDLLDEDA